MTLLRPVLGRYPCFSDLLDDRELDALGRSLRKAETIGRPLGDELFISRIETALSRTLRPLPRGPKPKAKGEAEQTV